jgi:hypothetical protein
VKRRDRPADLAEEPLLCVGPCRLEALVDGLTRGGRSSEVRYRAARLDRERRRDGKRSVRTEVRERRRLPVEPVASAVDGRLQVGVAAVGEDHGDRLVAAVPGGPSALDADDRSVGEGGVKRRLDRLVHTVGGRAASKSVVLPNASPPSRAHRVPRRSTRF